MLTLFTISLPLIQYSVPRVMRPVKLAKDGRFLSEEGLWCVAFDKTTLLKDGHAIEPVDVGKPVKNRNNGRVLELGIDDGLHNGFGLRIDTKHGKVSIGSSAMESSVTYLLVASSRIRTLLGTSKARARHNSCLSPCDHSDEISSMSSPSLTPILSHRSTLRIAASIVSSEERPYGSKLNLTVPGIK